MKNVLLGELIIAQVFLKLSDDLPTETMVFMVCGITGHWKHPIAYFLQNKLSASVKTQLIKDCIGLLHLENLYVMALVFDGAYNNQSI